MRFSPSVQIGGVKGLGVLGHLGYIIHIENNI